MNKDSLGDRMKGYENAYRMYLPRRLPVIVRDLLSYIAEHIDSNTCFSVDALLDREIPEELVEKFNLRVIKGEN